MVTIKWCLKQNKGLSIIKPNPTMADSYIKMAEESITVLPKIEGSNIWVATTTYYIFYYSLYALMLKVGVKCEIHTCSIEFMKVYLNDFYDETDMKFLQQAFSARIDLQYYADRSIEPLILNQNKKYCKDFFIKTKDAIAVITEKTIKEIRSKLKQEMG